MNRVLIEKESGVMYSVGKVFSGLGVSERKSNRLLLFLMQICTFKFQIGLHNLLQKCRAAFRCFLNRKNNNLRQRLASLIMNYIRNSFDCI